MPAYEQVRAAVYKALDNINSVNQNKRQISKENQTVLFGKGGCLNSLGLVNLIVAIEEQIAADFEIILVLADEKAFSLKESPFRTVETLINYAYGKVSEKHG